MTLGCKITSQSQEAIKMAKDIEEMRDEKL
jgi:hypothetical protein